MNRPVLVVAKAENEQMRRTKCGCRALRASVLVIGLGFLWAEPTAAAEPKQDLVATSADDAPFPDPKTVLEGQSFRSKFERDVFFLRRIRAGYSKFWPGLLEANLTVRDYVAAPEKLRAFIDSLGAATAGTDDLPAVTHLAAVTSDPEFYANTNAYRPDVLRAAANALLGLGKDGRRALTNSFSEAHYRTDAATLEILADTVGKSGVADPQLNAALAATAFEFTATNGGFYPRCTREAVRNLLLLPGGGSTTRPHLNSKELFKDPGRFQEIINSLDTPHAVELLPALLELKEAVADKLKTLAAYPGSYRDDLSELQRRLGVVIGKLQSSPPEENVIK